MLILHERSGPRSVSACAKLKIISDEDVIQSSRYHCLHSQTSHLLGFALYTLALNPEAQEKLVQEIDQLVDGSDVVSASTLGRMSYLKAVTKETFR